MGGRLASGLRAVTRPASLTARNDEGPGRGAFGVCVGSPGRTRTYNPPVNSRMLCRLSYRGVWRLAARVRSICSGRGVGKRFGSSRESRFTLESAGPSYAGP